MTQEQKIFFISDLHLHPSSIEVKQHFFDFLNHCDSSVDAIYILGDLFDGWIGDDEGEIFYQDIINCFKRTTERRIPIFIMHGNRDFLIGKKFLEKTGCQLLNDPQKISVYGTPVLLMHGDLLCTQDTGYLRLRKILRHPIFLWFFSNLPLVIRRKMAFFMRKKSMQHIQHKSEKIMDVSQASVDQAMTKHQVDFLIHGHTHKPAQHSFLINKKNATRIVLGAWDYPNDYQILSWNNHHLISWFAI